MYINDLDSTGRTALMVAVLEGRTDLIEVFLRHNASVDVGDSQQGRTCLHFAAEFGRIEIVKLLVVRIDFFFQNKKWSDH